jgi:cytidine deaminase
MSPERETVALKLTSPPQDPLIQGALDGAAASYAPYSRNWSGCGIETGDGALIWGRYVESAAFNPSVSSLSAALANLNMVRPQGPMDLKRAVLVEHPTAVRQYGAAKTLLRGVAPEVTLEHFEAQPQ